MLAALRTHKAEIVALLRAERHQWTAEDWRAFFDERAAVAEFDGGLCRSDAEARAFEACIAEWMNRHPVRSNTDRCVWCGRPDTEGHAIVPFGTEGHGHAWLHPGCWQAWHGRRRAEATRTLSRFGVMKPRTNSTVGTMQKSKPSEKGEPHGR